MFHEYYSMDIIFILFLFIIFSSLYIFGVGCGARGGSGERER
jgi:hypothetical protein